MLKKRWGEDGSEVTIIGKQPIKKWFKNDSIRMFNLQTDKQKKKITKRSESEKNGAQETWRYAVNK